MNVLVVDDNSTNRKLLLATLGAEEFTVFEAADGVEAMAVLEREKIDAIISDILMPRMDGYRLCYEVRRDERFRNLPFIIYTSTYTSPSDEKLSLELGADKFVRKPASAKEMVKLLQDLSPRPHAKPLEPLPESNVLKEYSERLVAKLEQKNAELSLHVEHVRRSEERFRRYFELGLIGMAITLPDQGCVEVNDHFCKLLGYSRDELLGMTWSQFTHPDDVATERAQLDRILAGESDSYSMETRFVRQDGQILHARISVKCVRRADGSVDYFVALVQDITESKQAQQDQARLAAIVESAEDAIIAKSLKGIVTNWNAAAERVYGYFAEEMLGKSITILIPPDRLPEWEQAQARVQKGERVPPFETARARKDGTRIDTSVSLSPLRDSAGRMTGVSAIVRDITQRKLAEEELRKSREQLRALAARLQAAREEESLRIAREIHDELGHALTSLSIDLVTLEQALSKDPPPRDKILQRTKAMAKLVAETGRTVQRIAMDLRPSLLDDLGLAAALEWQTDEFAERTGIGCRWRHKPADCALPNEQAIVVFRIFQEMLTNIARHAKAAKVDIRCAREGSSLVLSLRDDGRGFEEKKLSARTSLGLLGMRERALLIGGRMEIQSAPGQGTTVTLTVPINAAPDKTVGPKKSARRKKT